MDSITIIIGLIVLVVILVWILSQKSKDYSEVKSAKQSQSVYYGKQTEKFFPFLKDYPYDSRRFKFIGDPLDGIQFTDDEIIFIEFKSGKSKLSPRQTNIKELVENKKVSFETFRV